MSIPDLKWRVLVVSISWVSLVYAYSDIAITVDPPDRLKQATLLGDWNGTHGMESWQGESIHNSQIAGGVLSGSSAGDKNKTATLTLFSIMNPPDLDLGFNDSLQIRLRLPASIESDVIFSFKTTTRSQFAEGQSFRIPSRLIPRDGQWHTYRLDLGLIVWWRDRLTGLQIKLFDQSSRQEAFAIDYIEVGDVPGDFLSVNTNLNFAQGESLVDCQYMESKHACFWWSPQSYEKYSQFDPPVMGRRALRMIEECYQVYTKKLGYQEPTQTTEGAVGRYASRRFKTNHVTWFDGFWMGAKGGDAYLNVGGGGLRDEGWGNPVPHEYAHCLQGHQPGFLVGGHWESHANFLRMQRTLHFGEQFPADWQTDLHIRILELSNFHQDHKKLIYADYRIHQSLIYAQDALGLETDLVSELWIGGSKDRSVYDKLKRALPSGYDLADVVALGMTRWPFLDFAQGEKYQKRVWGSAADRAWYNYVTGSHLIPMHDQPGWWRVPFERAPEKYAFMTHVLNPVASNVTVDFRGLDVLGNDDDWRWCLIAQDTEGRNRYSPVWEPGQHRFSLEPNEHRVTLFVIATPDEVSLDLESYHNTKPTDKHKDRLRYPYQVYIEGAQPALNQLDWNSDSGRRHPKGQGWVATTARVDSSAYVGPHARVLGNARVLGQARIEDYAVVTENAVVQDHAIVSGFAVIKGKARIQDLAKVRDRAILEKNCVVADRAVIEDYAHVEGHTFVGDTAIVRGVSMPFGKGVLNQSVIADYDYAMDFTLEDGVQFNHIPWGGWYEEIADQFTKPRGLIAAYSMEAPEGDIIWDAYGAQHAILVGHAPRRYDSGLGKRVLSLNGQSQYIILDRSLCDVTEASFVMWFKPKRSGLAETLIFMGSSAGQSLVLKRQADGRLCFAIQYLGLREEVVSTQALPLEQWSHVAVSLDGQKGKLYVNGVLEGQEEFVLSPDYVLGTNDYVEPEAFYIGRGWQGQLFHGDITSIGFYNTTLKPQEILESRN